MCVQIKKSTHKHTHDPHDTATIHKHKSQATHHTNTTATTTTTTTTATTTHNTPTQHNQPTHPPNEPARETHSAVLQGKSSGNRSAARTTLAKASPEVVGDASGGPTKRTKHRVRRQKNQDKNNRNDGQNNNDDVLWRETKESERGGRARKGKERKGKERKAARREGRKPTDQK